MPCFPGGRINNSRDKKIFKEFKKKKKKKKKKNKNKKKEKAKERKQLMRRVFCQNVLLLT